MFFGKCFDQLHQWGPVFRFKTDPEYAHHVFRSFASEYFGDAHASAQLFATYKDCMCSIYWARCVNTGTMSRQMRRWTSSFDTDRSWLFQLHFDLYCKLAFNNCFSKFNDYTMLIILTSDFTNFQHLSKKIYPDVWAFLSLDCNVNEDRDGPTLTAFKERQVFITILILLRQSNYRSLTHWCLILSTAMYSWGTRDTLGHVTSFLGTTVSRSYQDRLFASLTSKLVDTIVSLLSRQLCGLMVLDNFQRGVLSV